MSAKAYVLIEVAVGKTNVLFLSHTKHSPYYIGAERR